MRLGLSRRALLTGLLGAPVAAAACRTRAAAPTFDGRFVDHTMEAGHALRDGKVPAIEPATTRTVDVLVLGGGVAGLTAAWQLRRAGIEDLVVVELDEAAGGTSRSDRSSVTEHPLGAHYLPVPTSENADLVELLRDVGSVVGTTDAGEPIWEETHLTAAPKERVFHRGLWHEGLLPRAALTAVEVEQLHRFEAEIQRYVALRDAAGRRAFAIPVAHSSDDAELAALDHQTMADWLDARGLRSPMVRWYVEYACRDDFGTELAETSAWYGLHYFASRIAHGGEEAAELLTWPSGNGFLVEHLVSRIGRERIVAGELVTSVMIEPSAAGARPRARVTTWSPATGRGAAYSARAVVVALPANVRARVLRGVPGATADAAPWAPTWAPWMVTNVHLSGRPESRGFPVAWDNVIHGSRSLGYVVATHQKGRATGPTVWTHYLPLSGPDPRAEREKLASLAWREAADVVLTDLAPAHVELARHVVRVDVMRWGHGMVRPVPGTFTSAARRRAAAPIGPLYFAHSDLSGVALFEEAFFHGTRAARELLAARAG
ncbi:FAD-dependent oxidoreductase [Myxococcota bacterium]|nr:FAD-dependent oxidoreductase [Myxococcota bacterium]